MMSRAKNIIGDMCKWTRGHVILTLASGLGGTLDWTEVSRKYLTYNFDRLMHVCSYQSMQKLPRKQNNYARTRGHVDTRYSTVTSKSLTAPSLVGEMSVLNWTRSLAEL